MPAPDNRWNYYFKSGHAVTLSGATVPLPVGHGMVSVSDEAEDVFFPAVQQRLSLIPGEIKRLEAKGLVEKHGKVR